MKLVFHVLKMVLLFSGFVSFAGGNDMGNGGDLIQCQPSAENSLSGYYSLDFLLTYKPSEPLITPSSYESSLQRIQEILNETDATLAASMAEFRRYLLNESVEAPRVWEPVAFGVIDITDEDIRSVNQIPNNCKSSEDVISLIQAVVRLRTDYFGKQDKVFYNYMPKALDVIKDRPLQASMLFVHEWLWDFSSNVETNRRINRFLHSTSIESMSPQQIRQTFLDLGLSLTPQGSEVFHPNWCQMDLDSLKKKLDPLTAWYPSGVFKILERKRRCSKDYSECTEWKLEEERKFNDLSGIGQGYVYVKKNKNEVVFNYPFRKKAPPVTSCVFDENGQFQCIRNLFQWENMTYDYPVQGSISGSCVVLKQRAEAASFGFDHYQVERVFYAHDYIP